ncbi:MAG TPA: cupin [Casimicrobiaceae bacterium]|nr:cupin [Casimicrobiaceae bacterium]
MSNPFRCNPARFILATAIASLFAAAPAFAGECPADKLGVNTLQNAPTAPVGVTEHELSSVDLSKENVHLDDRRLRFRAMQIQPGGVVPLHSHADRPALIMVNTGAIYENSSKCLVPIQHKAGDISREFLGTQHWWKNEGTTVVTLTIADIVNDKKPDTMAKNVM